MTIRIWQAFSCNNSTSYRLIARFADAATAGATGASLAEVLAKYAAMQPEDVDATGRSMLLLAREYGFDWQDEGWGSDTDGPHVVVEGEELFVYHGYCLGLGPGIPAYLTERGAKVDPESSAAVQMSVLFRAPRSDAKFDDDLAMLFAQPRDTTSYKGPRFRVPWSTTEYRGRASFFRDVGTVGLYFPVAPIEIAAVKAWLAGHGVEGPSIRYEEHADAELFAALAAARCTACTGMLEYLDPRLHDIETPQLVCKPCGGLYELSAFTNAAT
jgi:hypothetical protein